MSVSQPHLGLFRDVAPLLGLEVVVSRGHPDEHFGSVRLEEGVLAAEEDVRDQPDAPDVGCLKLMGNETGRNRGEAEKKYLSYVSRGQKREGNFTA